MLNTMLGSALIDAMLNTMLGSAREHLRCIVPAGLRWVCTHVMWELELNSSQGLLSYNQACQP